MRAEYFYDVEPVTTDLGGIFLLVRVIVYAESDPRSIVYACDSYSEEVGVQSAREFVHPSKLNSRTLQEQLS